MRNWQTTACVCFLFILIKESDDKIKKGRWEKDKSQGVKGRKGGRRGKDGGREGGREGHTLIVLSLEQVASFFP